MPRPHTDTDSGGYPDLDCRCRETHDVVVGAVRTSGGTLDQDIKVPDAAVAALKLT
jgi:uncharacterized protein GlcG (DUF336 family)